MASQEIPRRQKPGEGPMDATERNVPKTAAVGAAAAVSATHAVAGQPLAGIKTGFYEKGGVRIRYQEVGSGFPLLAIPGGGLNSRFINWPNAVINMMEEVKNDFRV